MDVLTAEEIERFVAEGFVHLPGAFPTDVAEACVGALWEALPVAREQPATWTHPVLRIAGSAAPPLVAAINTDRLRGAIDQLVGPDRWARVTGYGSFPVRFPSEEDPGDTGWHVDGSFAVNDEPPPWNYGLNVRSRGRALLVLMLYSDVGPDDAPTRIRVGSHADVARVLAPYGEDGAGFREVSEAASEIADARPLATAEGAAGDAYLCHPFLLHAASWPHRGRHPRFLGQPAILPAPGFEAGFDFERLAGAASPCEQAVRQALA